MMKNRYKDKLESLRMQIPIGIRHGLAILEEVDGDLLQAKQLFVKEMTSTIMLKANVGYDLALKHLEANRYDVGLSLTSIDEERYTLTERILKKYKNHKLEALEKIAYAVEIQEKLERDYWLDFEKLKQLQPQVSCLLVIVEWMSYCAWEGLDSALFFHLNILTHQLRDELSLPQVAENLEKAKAIYEQQQESQMMILAKDGSVGPTSEFSDIRHLLEEQESLLIDTLYEMVIVNLKFFP